MSKEALVFVALGSNLGDPLSQVRGGAGRLVSLSQIPLTRSSLWKTRPVDCPAGSGWFVNAVVGLSPWPGETPLSLLRKLQDIERQFGRPPRRGVNAPRPLDLDLIAWGDLVLLSPDLVLPHPRAHLRRFVLAPLAEIAPDWVLPGQRQTVQELLAGLKGEEDAERLGTLETKMLD